METFLGFIVLIVLVAAIFNIVMVIVKGLSLPGAVTKYREEREKLVLKKLGLPDDQSDSGGLHHPDSPKQDI